MKSMREAQDIHWRQEAAPVLLPVRQTGWVLQTEILPGGILEVEIKEDGVVYMTGEVGYIGNMTLGCEMVEKLRKADRS